MPKQNKINEMVKRTRIKEGETIDFIHQEVKQKLKEEHDLYHDMDVKTIRIISFIGVIFALLVNGFVNQVIEFSKTQEMLFVVGLIFLGGAFVSYVLSIALWRSLPDVPNPKGLYDKYRMMNEAKVKREVTHAIVNEWKNIQDLRKNWKRPTYNFGNLFLGAGFFCVFLILLFRFEFSKLYYGFCYFFLFFGTIFLLYRKTDIIS